MKLHVSYDLRTYVTQEDYIPCTYSYKPTYFHIFLGTQILDKNQACSLCY